MATGDTISAEKAFQWDVIHQVVPIEKLDKTVYKNSGETQNHNNTVKAFLEKSKPTFHGK